MAIQQIQPEELFQRKLGGQPLYSAVVVATGKKNDFRRRYSITKQKR